MKKKQKLIAIAAWLFISSAISSETASAAASANLNQARNGTDGSPVSPINWVNGNLGGSQAHYVEGMSTPFQCIMTGLTLGVQVTLTIGYDIKNSDKHAFDYLTHFNRILPHTFTFHSTPEIIDPLNGTGLGVGTPFTTYTIPAPSSAGTPVAGQPTNSFNALASSERRMTLYNGTIDTIYYLVQGNLTATQSETQLVIKFTPAVTTAVLLWGAHIASRNDWGYSGTPRSAGGISGSPFHMRLVSWSYGSLGSQDRSLAGGSVTAPPTPPLPVDLVHFAVRSAENTNVIEWTTASEINNDYFTLQRASETMEFISIATIKGAGNSSTRINYAWIDLEPQNVINYYRLIQTDFDGTQKIFETISILADDASSALSIVNTYPNPFTDDFAVTYHSENKSVTLIEIADVNGKRIWSEVINSVRGTNQYKFRDKNLMPDGFYFITLSQSQSKPVMKMIVKK